MSGIYTVMETIFPFEIMQYDFIKNAIIAILLITPLMGMLGTMAVNNKMAFFSDALGHSAFTGIALGVLLGSLLGAKDDSKYEFIALIAFGVLLALIITKIKGSKSSSADTIISVFSSTSVALGLVILSSGGNRFSSYSKYLIGDILSIEAFEILILAITLILVTVIWCLIYNKLLLLSINAELATSRGVKVVLVENIFVVLVAVVVMISIKWVGILLINSLLILPAASARNISRNSRQYLFSSIIIAVVCGLGGLIASYYLNTSAGATIVLLSAILFFITYIFRKE